MRRQEKLNYFWIVEKKKLEDKRAELRNKEREMQDIEEKHQVEIKVRGRDGRTGDLVLVRCARAFSALALPPHQVYKQRVKHLLYEHQDERTRQKLSAQVSLKVSQGDYRSSEAELKADKRTLKVELKELQLAHEDFIVGLKTVRGDCWCMALSLGEGRGVGQDSGGTVLIVRTLSSSFCRSTTRPLH